MSIQDLEKFLSDALNQCAREDGFFDEEPEQSTEKPEQEQV